MAEIKAGQIDITPRKKKYHTMTRPDGQPIDVNVTNINSHPDVARYIKELKFRGYVDGYTPPAEEKPKAKPRSKASKDE